MKQFLQKKILFFVPVGAIGLAALIVLRAKDQSNPPPKSTENPEKYKIESGRGAQTTAGIPPKKILEIQYASPAPRIAPLLRDPKPADAQVTITRGERSYSPKFYSGHSERLAAKLNDTVPIQISWPEDTIHSDVFVQAVHGGKIDGQLNYKRFPLTDTKTISFTFTPDSGPGSYEIVLRRGTTEEALGFWVPTGGPNDPPSS